MLKRHCILLNRHHNTDLRYERQKVFFGHSRRVDQWTEGQGIWSSKDEREITPEEVVACMVGLKLARLAEDISKDDSWVDIIGYAALGGEIINDEG
mgnify:CR=1 FL=1